jgi:hypothetical protein
MKGLKLPGLHPSLDHSSILGNSETSEVASGHNKSAVDSISLRRQSVLHMDTIINKRDTHYICRFQRFDAFITYSNAFVTCDQCSFDIILAIGSCGCLTRSEVFEDVIVVVYIVFSIRIPCKATIRTYS